MGLRLFIRKIFRGYSERETPGSIPNPEAKTLCADGTALLWVWESRSPRVFYSRGEDLKGLPLFLRTQKLLERKIAPSNKEAEEHGWSLGDRS